ncbi:MAG: glutamate 5-kinase [Gammaproteobacteria bacterium]|nr:glutamate 5-kinase [Gammaproteobacteria bacterium]
METQEHRSRVANTVRWVVKIGSALATKQGLGLNNDAIADWARQIVAIKNTGREIVIVTSGAVAEGAARLGWQTRPKSVNQLQAAAAVGQMGLVRVWELAFQEHGCLTAQILLTHEDIANRERYLNSRGTLLTLMQYGVIPVINENDTVATDEIKLGDNDTLAGLVSNLIEADLMVILTDQDGLMNANPRLDPTAKLIEFATTDDPNLDAIAGEGGEWGRGGMRTKISAARLAARSGTSTVIANGSTPDILCTLAAGGTRGTFLAAPGAKLAARKQWMAGTLRARGRLSLDEGACLVLIQRGRSLLAVGVNAVEGDFARGELVSCIDPQGREIARGLVNYSAAEVALIKGLPTSRLASVLGFEHEPELIHRDNLVVL